MTKIYVVSDTHFYHKNIIEYCNRPFTTVDEMNSAIIKNWNSIVSNDDIVFHLGDVGLGNKDKVGAIVSQLNGRKRLIKGNHDHFRNNAYYEMGFEFVSDYPIIFNDFIIMSHAPRQLVQTTPYFNVYGHVHNDENYKNTKQSKNVSIEVIDYKPLLIYDTDRNEYYNLD